MIIESRPRERKPDSRYVVLAQFSQMARKSNTDPMSGYEGSRRLAHTHVTGASDAIQT